MQRAVERFDLAADQTARADRVLRLEAADAVEIDEAETAPAVERVDALRAFRAGRRITADGDGHGLHLAGLRMIERRQRARHVVRRLLAERPPGNVESARLSEITELIGGLPAARREAFLLTAVAGLSYDEAAAVCGCPVGTIRSRVARARAQLIEALGATEQIADDTG